MPRRRFLCPSRDALSCRDCQRLPDAAHNSRCVHPYVQAASTPARKGCAISCEHRPSRHLARSPSSARIREQPTSPAECARDLTDVTGACPVRDELVLLASELAANAVLHSRSGHPGGVFTVQATLYPGDYAWVEVIDQGGQWPADTHDDEHGRGLTVVAAIAGEGNWGIAYGSRCSRRGSRVTPYWINAAAQAPQRARHARAGRAALGTDPARCGGHAASALRRPNYVEPARSAVPRIGTSRRRLVLARHTVETAGQPVVTPVHRHHVAWAAMEHVIAVIPSNSAPMRYSATVTGQRLIKILLSDTPRAAHLVGWNADASDVDGSAPLGASPVQYQS